MTSYENDINHTHELLKAKKRSGTSSKKAILKCYFTLFYTKNDLKLPIRINSMSVSNEKVSCANSSTDICYILKSNLFASQIERLGLRRCGQKLSDRIFKNFNLHLYL